MSEGVVSGSQSFTQLKTRAQLRDLVYAPLRDSERTFVEPWFVDEMLNEAYLDLNARLRLTRATATGTTSSTGEITLPVNEDFIEVLQLWVGTTPVTMHDDYTFNSYEAAGVTPYMSTNSIAILGRMSMDRLKIETYPQAVTTDYTLEYVKRPESMALDTDKPTSLAPEMQPRLVAYARAHAKWQEGEIVEGNQYMAQYEQGLPGSPRMTNNLRPASMTLIPEPGPFG